MQIANATTGIATIGLSMAANGFPRQQPMDGSATRALDRLLVLCRQPLLFDLMLMAEMPALNRSGFGAAIAGTLVASLIAAFAAKSLVRAPHAILAAIRIKRPIDAASGHQTSCTHKDLLPQLPQSGFG